MNIFIVSKPLQFMVCAALSESLNVKGELIVVNNFHGAKKFSDNAAVYKYFNSVSFFDSSNKAFLSLVGKKNVSKVFIDSDFGIKKNLIIFLLKLFNCKVEISLYEEGNGIYRNDLIFGRVRVFFYKLFFLKGSLGGSFFVKNIFVVNIEKYAQLRPELFYKAAGLKFCFNEWIENNYLNLKELFSEGFEINLMPRKEYVLYITGWEIDWDFVRYLKHEYDFFLIKPHPHIKDMDLNSYDNVIDPGIPVELIFIDILKKCETLKVYHSGTSALDYFFSDRIESFNIKEIDF